MNLIMEVELFDDVDELELLEFGVPRNLIIRQNYYHTLPEYKFFQKFRLRKETVMFLLPLAEEQLEFPMDINNSVSPINQFLTCLRYLATGSHIDCIADFMGMDSSTAGQIIHRVSRAIASLYRQFVLFPTTPEARALIKADFYGIALFPIVLGALDCTHVKVLSPGGNEAEIYKNKKDYFSINVQAICDANGNFLDVVARWTGSSHDSTIFNHSNVKRTFEGNQFPNCILLGDKGYPSKRYLLTPLINPVRNEEQLYNESHIRTRNKIECAFGTLKRFPVLAYGYLLQLVNVQAIIIASTVLYNVARLNNEDESAVDEEDFNLQELEHLILQGQIPPVPAADDRFNNGNVFRRNLIQTYFAQM